MTNDDSRLAQLKRSSLGEQALQAAWQLGALVRRVEHEAPAASPALREAVATLLQLREELARQDPRRPRQGELF
ncbi:MAG: hypothetical protein KDE27_05115 [Planctomycetes bacterium]|nr:hypothetical protein [Planctomycetota bacterium]